MIKLTEIICPICSITAYKDSREVTRCRKKNRNIYCSKECGIVGMVKKRTIHVVVDKNCLYCQKIFKSNTSKHATTCCSKECAQKYSYSFVNPDNISKSLIEYCDRYIKPNSILCRNRMVRKDSVFENVGVVCNSIFLDVKRNPKKTCSEKCRSSLTSTNSSINVNCGGETNYRKFKYNNIWMDSSWEIELAKWFDILKIEWVRSKLINFIWIDVIGKKHRYYPDFFLPEYNLYIDPKNKFLQMKDNDKLNRVRQQNDIILLSGYIQDIQNTIINIPMFSI